LGGPSGDHAKPPGGFVCATRAWRALTASILPANPQARGCEGVELIHDFDAVETAAERLASGALARMWRCLLGSERPRFVGVSVLGASQVLAALAVSLVAKRAWPGVPVIWGGAHATALGPEIAADPRYGRWIDGFVSGYAESTFRHMLRQDPMTAAGVFAAGSGTVVAAHEELDSVPHHPSLRAYGRPRLTLPVQTARGCYYARCTFCTYPAVEGRARQMDDAAVTAAIRFALGAGGELAVRDALATPRRLDLVASVVNGRGRFAATTRLTPRLGRAHLTQLVRAGLRTLELGVESIDTDVLEVLRKRQSVEAVAQWLEDAAGLDLHLVLNVMFGFPGQTLDAALATRRHFDILLRRRFPNTRFSVERNLLQVERRAPMAVTPERFGVRILGSWPWSSVLSWDAPAWRATFRLHTPHFDRVGDAHDQPVRT
jgi:hypothetical protein